MADYYTHMGFTLPANEKQQRWLLKMIQRMAEGSVPKVIEDRAEANEFDPDWDMVPECATSPKGLVIYSDDHVSIELVGALIQAYLIKFHEDKCFSFMWSYICSKPIPDGFGGGCMVITPKSLVDLDLATYAIDTMAEYDEFEPLESADL